jgi:hypothetical protein
MLRSGKEAKLTQNEQGVRIDVPWEDAWDPIDTVITLSSQPGAGCLSRGKPVTMSGPDTPGWPPKNAVDGNKESGWSSEMVKVGEEPWVTIDLGRMASISHVHLYPRITEKVVGYNFPVDFNISVSTDGVNFTKVLNVADYKVTSPRAPTSEYVWDPGSNDYKKAEPGHQTDDLSLSGAGRRNSADYPQFFVLPVGTQGRYVKITGSKIKDEMRMQFTEVEIFGAPQDH